MKKNLLAIFLLISAFTLSTNFSNAQFIPDSSQTFFVCKATGTQLSVSAFTDGSGGTYSFWIDKRNGNAGTAIYGQHLDSLGFPQWDVNGKLFYQENAKEVWLMKAVAWQGGILIGWVQGGFGIGGDTLYCNYYNTEGIAQWSKPTVAANKNLAKNIVYVGFDDMDVFPTDSGATVTFSLGPSGGNNYFSFNRIDFSGNLHWSLDTFVYTGSGYYYHSGYDNHNGFYVAASTGGLGADIFVGHFDLDGHLTIPVSVDITGTAGGRNNSQWKILCGSDTSAFIVWSSYTNQDISINKIKPNGTLPWNDAKQICAATSQQEYPDGIIHNDTIYTIWDDARAGGSYQIYMQKTTKAGNMVWTKNGIQLSNLISYIPYPKLATSGKDVVATYLVNGGYRAQKIHPDSTTAWYQNGVVINVPNVPFYGDYQLVSSGNESVTAIWTEQADNICAAKVLPNGSIASFITEHPVNYLRIFPNPATTHLVIEFEGEISEGRVEMLNNIGQQVYSANIPHESEVEIDLEYISPGIYFVKVINGEKLYVQKIVVE